MWIFQGLEINVNGSDDNYDYNNDSYYYDDAEYQTWTGPGYYYGQNFSDENDYYYWLDNDFDNVYWNGPNWYYGIWFGDQAYFNDFRCSVNVSDTSIAPNA